MGSLAMRFTLVGRGAYFHGVLINTCNFLVYSVQLFGSELAAIYFRPRGFFSADFCPMFTAFFRTRDTVSNRLLPTHSGC